MNRMFFGVAFAILLACSGLLADDNKPDPKTGLIPTAKAVAMFEKRVQKNEKDAGSRMILGRLYLRRAKEEDDFASNIAAEKMFRESIKIRPSTSTKTYLAQSLLAQHKFAEALKLANEVLKKSPSSPVALAARADALLELGRYKEAEAALSRLADQGKSPAVLARLARLAEIKGDEKAAAAMIESAIKRMKETGQPQSRIVWYEWRLGSLLLAAGKWSDAKQHFNSAIDLDSTDSASLAGLAAVAAAQGDFETAIKTYHTAVESSPGPPIMTSLADVYQRTGDTKQAKHWYDQALEIMIEESKTPAAEAHFRELCRFYSHRGQNSSKALELARLDVQQRQDIYAYDTLAWALYRNEEFKEAADACEQSLRMGTRDALLHYHAGVISHHLKETSKAKSHLETALSINSEFSVLGAPHARSLLKKLGQ